MDVLSQFSGQKKQKIPRKKAVAELWNKIFYGVGIASFLLVVPNLAPKISPHVEKGISNVQSSTGGLVDATTEFFGSVAKKVEKIFQDALVKIFS
jgi:hypothetical protein